ncbi:diacylglycerol/lipid kinase family protein [Pseudobacteriovorax antillogorgiicola]|uniref:Lipid kinase, YegS/Rv2252/BmrU family n=1 Tax=Pseudobacteriovorax antillogorgiicola TaxID=1513793 RepID=A0A1Y6BRX6_9BACT|nr:diacylglycerol kinase family protein [Pseudobacteriovorax antillogorgiicola]TCS53089.1 YegS/Rv2252/BmrU family lipid kinase [Pseudobacteriovorax antillogorgiicola]SMF26048.1 lipid kinase, YegS/Rv2252/BmrU family [Pseudobacteriovorax antillogorgiicola]
MDKVVVLNPHAGDHDRDLESWKELLPWDIRVSQEPGDAGRISRELAENGVPQIIVGGGDGTIREVADSLMSLAKEKRPQLAVLPLGTANDFCKSIHIGPELETAIKAIKEGLSVPLDVIQVTLNDKTFYGMNVACVGFVPEMTKRVSGSDKELWGSLVYALKSVETAQESRCYHLAAQLDGESYEWDSWNIVLGNGRFAGGGVPIAPEAELDDGLLDVYVFNGETKLDFLVEGVLSLLGQHSQSVGVESLKGKSLKLNSDLSLPISLDGELLGEGDVEFQLMTGALDVVVGQKTQ